MNFDVDLDSKVRLIHPILDFVLDSNLERRLKRGPKCRLTIELKRRLKLGPNTCEHTSVLHPVQTAFHDWCHTAVHSSHLGRRTFSTSTWCRTVRSRAPADRHTTTCSSTTRNSTPIRCTCTCTCKCTCTCTCTCAGARHGGVGVRVPLVSRPQRATAASVPHRPLDVPAGCASLHRRQSQRGLAPPSCARTIRHIGT